MIEGSYFEPEDRVWESDRAGIRFVFHDRPLPLERLFGAFEQAGLWVETLREPRPSETFVREHELSARRQRVPLFLHLRAVKP